MEVSMPTISTPIKMYLSETAVVTTYGIVWQAIQFIGHRIYFALGNKDSAWQNDALPPIPSPNLVTLPQVLGYKEVDIKSLVKPDVGGSISFKGQNFKLIDTADGFSEDAYWVYVKAVVDPDDLPLITFRSAGLFLDLTRVSGVPDSQKNLLPAEVQDTGILFRVANFSATPRAGDKKTVLEWIIEFGLGG